jgi:hypothetical protein
LRLPDIQSLPATKSAPLSNVVPYRPPGPVVLAAWPLFWLQNEEK